VKKNNNAVTPIISIVLALLIVTSAVTSILLWGVPYIESLRSEAALKNAEMQFNTVVDGVGDLVNSNPGEKKVTPITIDEGSISVDKDESDRTILLYSYNSTYNFTVSGLNDSDKSFWLTMLEGDVTKAKIYWLDDGRTCFLAGTKVTMGDGSYKNIESVQIGDKVKSYDEQTGEIIDCKVTHVFRHSPEEMTDYYLVINNDLRVTPNHRFYSDGNWVYAGDLRIGDPLFPREEDKDYNVYSIDRIYERAASFDLEVERCHTYFVSIADSVDILVHNPLYERYNTGDNTFWLIGGIKWGGQTFTIGNTSTNEDHVITSVKLLLSRGTNPGIITVSIRATADGKPTGNDLAVGTTNGNTLPTPPLYEWREISLSPHHTLLADTQYAIIARCLDGGGADVVYWRLDSSSPTYTGGTYIRSEDDNSTWDIHAGYDSMFEEYGTVVVPPNNPPDIPSDPNPEDDATDVDINADLSWTGGDPDSGDTVTYDVYFGTMSSPPRVVWGQSGTTYDPTLAYSTQYYWKIVAFDNHGASTSGPIWSFTTGDDTIEPREGIIDNDTCCPDGTGNFSAKGDFKGTMVIDLYDNDCHFGTIWLFDSNSITYKPSFNIGTNVIIENGGIIYSYPDNSYIEDAPYTYAEGNTFTMRIIQMIASSSSIYEGSGNIRMSTNLYKSYIREREDVYCFRFQFYGDNADAWLDYYDDTYDFKREPPDTLFYESSDALRFTLVHSIVGFSIF